MTDEPGGVDSEHAHLVYDRDELMELHQTRLRTILAEAEADPESKRKWHYRSINEMPKHIHKYWRQRHSLFSKYDSNVWLTDKAWFGATPESVATAISDHVLAVCPPHKTTIIDVFAGTGSNAIAFALSNSWDRVIAIEADEETAICGMHNSRIYGVDDRITWIHSDSFAVLGSAVIHLDPHTTAIFASPPWGGPDYTAADVFDLGQMKPYSLDFLFDRLFPYCFFLVLYLPRTSDLDQLAAYGPVATEGAVEAERARSVVVDRPVPSRLPVEHYCINGFSKALCAFYGATGEISEKEWPRTQFRPS